MLRLLLCLCSIPVVTCGSGTNMYNAALLKNTTQSSVSTSYNELHSGLGVDGGDTEWAQIIHNCSTTKEEMNASWKVIFNTEKFIYAINITTSYEYPLGDFVVELGSCFNGGCDYTNCYQTNGTVLPGETIQIQCDTANGSTSGYASKIRIRLLGSLKRRLSLCEVEVYSTDAMKDNIAFNQTTYQSSVQDGAFPRSGWMAVDGNDNQSQSYCSATSNTSDPWWQVDLGSEKKIELLAIHGHALENVTVYVGVECWPGQACYNICAERTEMADHLYLTCDTNTTARYVKIVLNKQGVLSLCDVKVLVYDDPTTTAPTTTTTSTTDDVTYAETTTEITNNTWTTPSHNETTSSPTTNSSYNATFTNETTTPSNNATTIRETATQGNNTTTMNETTTQGINATTTNETTTQGNNATTPNETTTQGNNATTVNETTQDNNPTTTRETTTPSTDATTTPEKTTPSNNATNVNETTPRDTTPRYNETDSAATTTTTTSSNTETNSSDNSHNTSKDHSNNTLPLTTPETTTTPTTATTTTTKAYTDPKPPTSSENQTTTTVYSNDATSPSYSLLDTNLVPDNTATVPNGHQPASDVPPWTSYPPAVPTNTIHTADSSSTFDLIINPTPTSIGSKTDMIPMTETSTQIGEQTIQPSSQGLEATSGSDFAFFYTTIHPVESVDMLSKGFTSHISSILVLCSCYCKAPNETDSAISTVNLKNHLAVDKRNVSKFRRRFYSVLDERPSAISIGSTGIFCLAFVFCLFVLSDVDYVVRNKNKIADGNM